MFRHYLAIAARNFRRAPFSTSINLLALALGLTCFIVAYGVGAYWNQSERHFPNAARTYVVTTVASDGRVSAETSAVVAKYLKLDFPQLEAVARLRGRDLDDMGELLVSAGERKLRLGSAYADPEFLHIFDLPFIAGDARAALREPDSVVLTQDAAERLFGSANAVGRRVLLDNFIEATVTGVIGPIPQPSHLGSNAISALSFDVLGTSDLHDRLLARAGELPGNVDAPFAWRAGNHTTYFLVPEQSQLTRAALIAELKRFAARRIPPDMAKKGFSFSVTPVSNLVVDRLNGMLALGADIGISITTLFVILGGLVLVVACLNYANLATALATMRTKEVGLRRVVGAARGQVAMQYLLEALLSALCALVLALFLIALITPALRTAAGVDLGQVLLAGAGFWGFLAVLVTFVGILAGAYPALMLSRVRPVEALRTRRVGGGINLAPALLVAAQFTAASFLLILVIVMYAQNRELRRSALGDAEDRLAVVTNLSDVTQVDPKLLREELLRLPEVRSVAGYRELPWTMVMNVLELSRSADEGETSGVTVYFDRVDHDFFSTLDMRAIAGRTFERSRGDDLSLVAALRQQPAQPVNAVVDRQFAARLGFDDPQDAIDRIVFARRQSTVMQVRIVGVVEERPLHIVGMGATSHMYFLEDSPRFFIVRIAAGRVDAALEAITDLWGGLSPNVPLQLSFMDTLFDQNYRLFGRINQMFAALAFFALAISVMGLFGMAIHMAQRRTHEIGVRKTLGASTQRILAMLVRDFSKPVIVANLIAWPLAFVAAQIYLSVFIQRVSLSATPFIMSLVVTVAVAWAALSWQTIRAARRKPAEVLRYE